MLATQNSIPHTTELQKMLLLPCKMTFSRCPTPATQFVTTPRSPDNAIRKKHVTIYTPHFTLHTVQVALLHSTLYTSLLTLHALHVTQHSTLHPPTLQTLHFTDYASPCTLDCACHAKQHSTHDGSSPNAATATQNDTLKIGWKPRTKHRL